MMRKKVFFRVFSFTAVAVVATVVLITLALTVANNKTGAFTWVIIRKELPYVLGILAAVLGASVPVSYAITGAIIQPLEQLGEHIDHIDQMQTDKELRPFVEKIQAGNEKKRQLEKQKKQFTANVSHELKTPLTSIAGYAELIENGMARPEDIQPFAHTIRKQALRLVNLAEDIIQLSQLEESDGEILFEEVNLTELAADCVQSLQINAQNRTVRLQLDGPEAPVYIKGNKSLLEELLYNLCDNAIRYNKPEGSVTVTLSPEACGAALQVADTGIGIPEKYRERIFERFFRVDKSRSKETGGTGLGLAIVKHIAQVHHATLALDSREEQGTTVTIHFPE